MNLRNKVTLIGRIGVEPTVVTLQSGDKMAKITMATNEVFKNKKGQKEEHTQWHNVVMFGKQVEIIEKYFNKGKEIAIEGKLINRSWETKDGEKRYSTEVLATNFVMLSKARKAS